MNCVILLFSSTIQRKHTYLYKNKKRLEKLKVSKPFTWNFVFVNELKPCGNNLLVWCSFWCVASLSNNNGRWAVLSPGAADSIAAPRRPNSDWYSSNSCGVTVVIVIMIKAIVVSRWKDITIILHILQPTLFVVFFSILKKSTTVSIPKCYVNFFNSWTLK